MNRIIDFYEVSTDYISYLTKFDSRVPRVDYSATGGHEKFLCGIVLSISVYNYFAPISSFTTQQRTNFIIKNEEDKPISSIRFSFMIPLPHGTFTIKKIQDEQSPAYRRLLNWELDYCNKNAKAIFRTAKYIYNSVVVKKDPLMIKNCCNFNALEVACTVYIKTIL